MSEQSPPKDLYAVLGAEPSDSPQQLKDRYKQLALKVTGHVPLYAFLLICLSVCRHHVDLFNTLSLRKLLKPSSHLSFIARVFFHIYRYTHEKKLIFFVVKHFGRS